MLPYAARQLGAITSTKDKLVKVTFDIRTSSTECELDVTVCKSLDDLLSGDQFPSLENIFLHKEVATILFPKLSKVGLLKTLSYSDSFWKRYV